MDDRKTEKTTGLRADICDVHSFGATAGRAFAALTAVEPEPVADPEPKAEAVPKADPSLARASKALSADAIRRIADRAEAASRKPPC